MEGTHRGLAQTRLTRAVIMSMFTRVLVERAFHCAMADMQAAKVTGKQQHDHQNISAYEQVTTSVVVLHMHRLLQKCGYLEKP